VVPNEPMADVVGAVHNSDLYLNECLESVMPKSANL